MKTPTVKEVLADVVQMDPKQDPGSEEVAIAVLLLGSALVGPNIRKLKKWSGYSPDLVRMVAVRCEENGIWKRGRVRADWFNEESGGVALWADVAVVKGWLARAPAKSARPAIVKATGGES